MKNKKMIMLNFLPDATSLKIIETGIKEWIGNMFYFIVYWAILSHELFH